MASGNDMKTLRNWLLGILGTLLTTGIVAAVAFGWSTSKAQARMNTQLEAISATVQTHERTMLRVEGKLDNHIQAHIRENGG